MRRNPQALIASVAAIGTHTSGVRRWPFAGCNPLIVGDTNTPSGAVTIGVASGGALIVSATGTIPIARSEQAKVLRHLNRSGSIDSPITKADRMPAFVIVKDRF